MGGTTSTSVTSIVKQLNDMVVDSFTEGVNKCKSDFTAWNKIHVECDWSPEQIQAYANSIACSGCLSTHAGQEDPSKCLKFCTPPCSIAEIKQRIWYTYIADCKMNMDTVVNMQTDFIQKLESKVTNTDDAFGQFMNKLVPGKTDITVLQDLDLQNKVKLLFTTRAVQKIYSGITTQQEIFAKNYNVQMIDQEMSYSVILKGIMDTSVGQDITTKLESDVKAILANETKGIADIIKNVLNSIDNFVNTGGKIVLYIVAGIALFGIAFVFIFKPLIGPLLFGDMGSDSDSASESSS